MPSTDHAPAPLLNALHQAVAQAGGWLGFDRFMALALYAPEGGYYAGGLPKFGAMPASGSDFVTAPECSPWFGRTLARQVGQALQATGTQEVWEFGAGTGALAAILYLNAVLDPTNWPNKMKVYYMNCVSFYVLYAALAADTVY